MKNSSLAFFHETTQGTIMYRLPNNDFIPEHECYSHSVILATAGYMVWKFPYLPTPGFEGVVEPKFREESFPDRLAVTHPMFDNWTELFLNQSLNGHAFRMEKTLYLKIKISNKYGSKLKENGFLQQYIPGKLKWKHLIQNLSQQRIRTQNKNKNILLLTCSVQEAGGRGTFNAPAIMIGLFFNNENWKLFRIMKGHYPTNNDYKNAHQIIIPGSTLCLSKKVEPQIQKLMEELRQAFLINETVKYLGICFGHQLLSQTLNPGSVRRAKSGTLGTNKVQFWKNQIVKQLEFLQDHTSINLYEDHGDEVHTLPEGFIKVASSNNCDIEMMASKCGRFFSMQAHPQYTSSRFQSVLAVNKMLQNDIFQAQHILQMITNPTDIPDHSYLGQQICRKFLSK